MAAPPRPGLSRDRILDAAGELLAADPAALSMRKLAERLDVTPMALYRWFRNRDDLLDALTERLVAPAGTGGDPDAPWIERAVHYATAIRRSLVQHLPLLRADGASRRLTANVVRDSELGLQLMLELGYRDAAAVDAYRVLFWTVLDYCLVVDATDALPTVDRSDEAVERALGLEGELADRMPALASLLPFFTALDPDEFFERTVRTVLGGLQHAAPVR